MAYSTLYDEYHYNKRQSVLPPENILLEISYESSFLRGFHSK